MNCRIVEQPVTQLKTYNKIPIRFEVQSVFKIEGDNPNTAKLVEKPIPQSWIKDYDTIKGEGPTRLAERWDVSNWGIIAAYVDDQLVGSCVLAYNTDGVDKLEGRDDLVILWDLRIHPDHRRRGIGRRLFKAALHWASNRQCREIRIETQNINVPACRFYQEQGCRLISIKRSVYEECPDEIELIWSLDI